ncbi:hypothetical protein KFE25_013340 [Diacronema lutheri]|uniref:FAD-dependent urate hydroxylase HpyO/Asp monooxygenase CreE-like FAD/NAD(P)-binding domain-containing protein n=1 Tax=Diacronema lutheri TaxID=2081491 RepID=A0A8J5XTS3_DIALT|nr:hypothetical protein KFE25_013340 [Diacronema lutheri]
MEPPDVDVAIVGAGPCGLAVAARLVRDCRAAGLDERLLLARTRVLDPAGTWLAGWRGALAVQRVRTLRSPTFAHPHPSRAVDDALRAFARARGRESELMQLPAAGAGWAAPGARLFADFCDAALDEFALRPLVRAARVARVRREGEGAVLELDDGRELRARFVVLALGAAAAEPVVPGWARTLAPAARAHVVHVATMRAPAATAPAAGGARWLAGAARALLAALLAALGARRRRLLIVGGGLSAAQLALHAANDGGAWGEVVLCARAPLAVRPFDIDARWMARHWRPTFDELERAFYAAGAAERAALLRAARPGGSVTPEAHNELRARAAARWAWPPWRAALRVLEAIEVEAAAADRSGGALHVALRGAAAGGGTWDERFDEVWLATGARADVSAAAAARAPPDRALFASLHAHWRAARVEAGMPVLTPTLRWAEDAPVYVCGALSALQVGPDAFNLAGAAAGAARISRDLLARLAAPGGTLGGGSSGWRER